MRIRDWSSDVCSSDLSLVESANVFGSAMSPSRPITMFLMSETSSMFATSMPIPAARSISLYSAANATTSGLKIVKPRSEEHTSELQSLMRISYAVFCLKKTKTQQQHSHKTTKQY